MLIQRWYPYHDVRRIENAMNRFWRSPVHRTNGQVARDWAVPLDVVEDGDNFVVTASLPGLDPEGIDVTIDDGVLTITAETETQNEDQGSNYLVRERRTGKFRRALRLPEAADAEKAEPKFENGVLTITLPKLEAKKPKRLAISTS